MAKKGKATPIVILILFVAVLIGIYVYRKVSTRHSLASQIAALSPRGAPPQTIEDLRRSIALYERKIEEHLRDTTQTGVYWKILGSRLMDGRQPLYREAFKALENAVRYHPDDETVHFLVGFAASNIAVSEYFDLLEQEEYFRIAEAAYLRAINLFGRYSRALYNLSVLYVYHLDRPEDAIPHMELYFEINTRDTHGMFLLASARALTNDFGGAVELYDRIISLTRDTDIRYQAEHNKQQVMDAWYR